MSDKGVSVEGPKVKLNAAGLRNLADHAKGVGTEREWMSVAIEWMEAAERHIESQAAEISRLRELLALARCPNGECDGNGTVVRVVPVCCGAMDADGCCGDPLPSPQPEECEWCHHRAALTGDPQ